ncbi:TonB family protein [Azospirillum palustre]
MSGTQLHRSEKSPLSDSPGHTARWGFLLSTALHAGAVFLLAGFGVPHMLHAPESPFDVTFVEPGKASETPREPATPSNAADETAEAKPAPAQEPPAQASPAPSSSAQTSSAETAPDRLPADAAAPPSPRPVAVKPQAAPVRRAPAEPARAKLVRAAQTPSPPSDAAVKTPREQVKNEYAGLIQTIVARNRIYPQEAELAKMEGTVVVQFRLMADGSIRKLKVSRSSGHAILDNAAKDIIRCSAPFPPIPAVLKIGGIDLTIGMNYELD